MLKDDGHIFISIDEDESPTEPCAMNIWEAFVACFIWVCNKREKLSGRHCHQRIHPVLYKEYERITD